MKQLAFFGELTYSLTEKWSVTGGARWFEFDRQMFDKYNVPFGLPAQSDPDANGLVSKGKASDTSFKFATKYQFTPDVMVYALYSEGFRLGGQNSQRAADSGQVPLKYGPDTLANYEAGIKSQWLDNRLRLNLSAFLMKWDDIQIHFDSTDAYWIEGNINGVKAEQKGVEFNGEWCATDRLNFAWSAFLASPEFTEDTLVPNSDPRGLHPQGLDAAGLAEGEVLGLGRVHVPRLPAAGGRFLDAVLVQLAGQDLEQPDRDRRTNDREFLLPEMKSARSSWGSPAIAAGRRRSSSATSSTTTASPGAPPMRGEIFGDPRLAHVEGIAAAAQLLPLVQQEMVTVAA